MTGEGWNWTPRDPVRNKCMDYTDNNLEGKAYVWLITEILMSVLPFFLWGRGGFAAIEYQKERELVSYLLLDHLTSSRAEDFCFM